MDAVTNMKSFLCGSSDVELHVSASVLKTYYSMAVQVATATDTDEQTRTQMQTISTLLGGLILNYFRVVRLLTCASCSAREAEQGEWGGG
jgi:hypothetical protein